MSCINSDKLMAWTAFELLLALEDKAKLVSKVYNILIANASMTDIAKLCLGERFEHVFYRRKMVQVEAFQYEFFWEC